MPSWNAAAPSPPATRSDAEPYLELRDTTKLRERNHL
jgi:hypothetical protein